MADNHTPAGSSTSTTANISTVPQPQDAQVLPSQALEGKFMLSHGVRLSVVITSACLAACGLALIVLGAVGSSSNFLQGLSGLNVVVTGVSLLLAASFGCLTFIQSKAKSVGRLLLICVVVTCHTSGAFAFQSIIIFGQLVGRYQAETCDVITPNGAGLNSDVLPYCPKDTSLVFASCILPLSIFGFFLGVVCSGSCYFAAPRLLCCLVDMYKGEREFIPIQQVPTNV
ncbi:uncharacterized protein [Asterias amurensis]|uniref:uncharacterized protein n=1 Tax=Asterias amurensis TaxID=7602 RepID=UPI003AB26260